MPSPQEAETIFEDLFAYDSSQSIESVAHHPFNTTTIIPFTLIDEPTIVEKSKEVDVEVSVPVVVAPDVSVPDADAIKPGERVAICMIHTILYRQY
jgi:ureidoglycolate hydrolase